MAAISQIRDGHSQGRAYYDKKLAEGKTPKEALRCLIGGLSVPRSGQPGGGSPVAPGEQTMGPASSDNSGAPG
jgi:hypothetical protein